MEPVKVAFETPIQPGDTVAWISRRYGTSGWKKGKVRRIAIIAEEGYKYDYATKQSIPYVRNRIKITVTKERGYGTITFSKPNNLLKVSVSGAEIKV